MLLTPWPLTVATEYTYVMLRPPDPDDELPSRIRSSQRPTLCPEALSPTIGTVGTSGAATVKLTIREYRLAEADDDFSVRCLIGTTSLTTTVGNWPKMI
jgi:hypothetical protein